MISIRTVLAASLLLFPATVQSQDVKPCVTAHNLILHLQEIHWDANPDRAALSERAYEAWINELDPKQYFLTREALEPVAYLKSDLVDQVEKAECDWLSRMSKVYRQQLKKYEARLDWLETYPLDYKQEDEVVSDWNHPLWEDSTSLTDYWRRITKFNVLDLAQSWYDSVDLEGEALYEAFLEKEPIWRHSFIASRRCQLEYLLQADPFSQVTQALWQGLMLAHDPHTAFFSETEAEAFNSSLSTDALSFGVQIGKNLQGEWAIAYLAPGSSVWEEAKLEEGDRVLEVQVGSDSLDLNCLQPEQLYQELMLAANKKLHLRVRKDGGAEVRVTIEKEELEVVENRVEAFVLKGEQPVGYVYLPSFFTDEEDYKGGSSDEIAKAVSRLKKEGAEGLILDMRDNGGGSLQEAINLAGIFVEFGPLGLRTDREGNTMVLRDPHRGRIFEGPLIILVNGASASATEIMSMMLRDRGRALIVGQRTFGKGTGQSIVPLVVHPDSRYADAQVKYPFQEGYLKFTTSAFYDLHGQTYQGEGLEPDILIPSIYERLYTHEKDELASLATGTVQEKYTYPGGVVPIDTLLSASQARQQTDSVFGKWQLLGDELHELVGSGSIRPLQWERHWESMGRFKSLQDNIEAVEQRKSEAFTATNPAPIQLALDKDPIRAKQNQYLLKVVQGDPTIEEAYRITLDWIKLKE